MEPQNEQDWIILAIIHLSTQVQRLEQKVDIILRNTHPDFSKEDAAVLQATKSVKEAIGHIPPRVPPGTTQ